MNVRHYLVSVLGKCNVYLNRSIIDETIANFHGRVLFDILRLLMKGFMESL